MLQPNTERQRPTSLSQGNNVQGDTQNGRFTRAQCLAIDSGVAVGPSIARARVAITHATLRACCVGSARCISAARVGICACQLRARVGRSAQYPVRQEVSSVASSGLAVCAAAACERGICGAVGDRHTVEALIGHPILEVEAVIAGVNLAVRVTSACEDGSSGTVSDRGAGCIAIQTARVSAHLSQEHRYTCKRQKLCYSVGSAPVQLASPLVVVVPKNAASHVHV